MSFDPPYSTGIFETIVNVHFGNLYLVVRLSGANQSFSLGPYPGPLLLTPSFTNIQNLQQPGVKLLDTQLVPGGNNAGSAFSGCFVYDRRLGIEQFWALHPHSTFAPTNQTCPFPDEDVDFTAGPVNYARNKTVAIDFLFSVPSGPELVTIDIGEIMKNFDSGFDPATGKQTTTQGGATIHPYIYSRVKRKVTKLNHLIDYTFLNQSRYPTEDDSCFAEITRNNQGSYQINVRLDKDPEHAQTDNYGKTFQPYKVTLKPNIGTDLIPSQPPPRLDLPPPP